MVFWRGLGWAYSVAKQITAPQTYPELVETPDETILDPDMRLQIIMAGALESCKNYNVTAGIAKECYLYVDPEGSYYKVGHFSVLAGLYLIDNGERRKQRRAERCMRELQQARTDITFKKLQDAEELQIFTEISFDLTMSGVGSE